MNGKKLKEIRKELGLTQTELANLIGRTSMRTVQNWESDKNPIPAYVEELLINGKEKINTPIFVNKEKNKQDISFNDLPIGEQMKSLNEKLEYLIKSENLNRVYLKTIMVHLDITLENFKPVEEDLEKNKKTASN